jgi:hypothetical protein
MSASTAYEPDGLDLVPRVRERDWHAQCAWHRAVTSTSRIMSLSSLLHVAAALLLAACANKPDARAASSDADSAAAHHRARGDGDGRLDPNNRFAPGRTGVISDSGTAAKLISGRTMHDSVSYRAAIRAGTKALAAWPKGPAALDGSILPAHRVVAFYGNPLSKKMGVLGEYPVDVMLTKLDQQVAAWRQLDPSTPVQPALHLIAVVAQGAPGRDGLYRLRMDTSLIEKVYAWAERKHALLFLDIQVGGSTLQAELPRLLPFLKRPNVHLGIDPEFSMHYARQGMRPGTKIGMMDAADVNYAISTLVRLVQQERLPPKVLIVHRFTRRMVTNASQIRLDPRVQVVMNMDGWGPPWLKFDSYRDYEVSEPVQYTGFKLFYHNDVRKGDPLLTPAEVHHLLPRPLYIQYQ